MAITRRRFICASGAGLAALALPARAAAATGASFGLRAHAFAQEIVRGRNTTVWGYNGSVPGPVLRYRKGERVRIALENAIPQPTTVHWHGLRVPNAMDGVPYVTQKPVEKGERFDYEFTAADSGTFWYHPHQKSFEQVARGLYGVFIVDEERPLEVDRELIWQLSDFKLGDDGQQVDDFGRLGDLANDGRIGNVIAWNGRSAGETLSVEVAAGERLRIRLVNTASARIFALAIEGHTPRVIAYDGQGVTPHEPPGGRIVLGPGMRADVVLDCTAVPGTRHRVSDTWRGDATLLNLVYLKGQRARPGERSGPIALAPNSLPEPDPSKATEHYILFEGGMRGTPILGIVDGKPTGIYDLMQKHGLAWTMNYTAEHEHALLHVPLLRLRQHEHVLLRMVNHTDYVHPMHLHGHFFRVVAVDGKPTRLREWRDTVMVGSRETVEVAFVADNPGEWMFHCHILEHAAGGMMGTIVVE